MIAVYDNIKQQSRKGCADREDNRPNGWAGAVLHQTRRCGESVVLILVDTTPLGRFLVIIENQQGSRATTCNETTAY